ncbi:uncharacterized protein [Rutidosis leptorrhynchoides]|uniref:uncharacterized protein n=1 Tax=Rutidosis leptorrhynchoides TaxID=125765 RepID=UPI003A99226C
MCLFSVDLRGDASNLVDAHNEDVLEEERFLKQKSKIEWVRVGDRNSSYFHKIVKGRIHRSRILGLLNVQGSAYIPNLYVDHFELFLGMSAGYLIFQILDDLFVNKLNFDKANYMTRPFTPLEVTESIFGIENCKSPGPDGYTAAFFKASWDIVRDEIIDVVHDFYFREKQSSFILGRRISNNSLLTLEIMRNYHLSKGPPICAFKVDIQKAYDTGE